MGRKWNNIKYGKASKDAARGKVYARFGKEIYMAAKNGDPDVGMNRNLAAVVDRAKVAGVPRDIIDRAINKAKSGVDENYEPIRYEGYGPSGSAIIVDALTDNVNRTVAEVRSAFKKNGGNMGVSGAVSFMFEPTALFVFEGSDEEVVIESLMEAEVDVRDVENEEGFISVTADQDQFAAVQKALTTMGITEFETAELTMLPTTTNVLSGDDLEKFLKLIDALNADDDVSHVYHNVELMDEA
ncbi:MAG: YebC/PmpR family DNA-binding transcriptional regulator [Defluviitaleaceae bacterium]|nr:YebC/PmpR family DNA-binding transcriptional regulator [Defluviitaleaceae bacterium]